jgi:hypothetical protein
MATREEEDYPVGHPARFDYDPDSKEAKEWARKHHNPKGERDFPVDHPKAVDTPGNDNATEWKPGIDPARPHHEEHTGRSPKVAKKLKQIAQEVAKSVPESPAKQPVEAPDPPPSRVSAAPSGQPDKGRGGSPTKSGSRGK